MSTPTSTSQPAAVEGDDAASPPAIWEAERFTTFRKTFSAQEQRELLEEDYAAEMRVCMILATVITAGLVLATTSVFIVTVLAAR